MHLGKTTPDDFANDLRRRPQIHSYLANLSSFAARAICVISPGAEYNKQAHDYLKKGIDWMTKNDRFNPELIRFRAEAEQRLGVGAPAKSTPGDGGKRNPGK